MTVGELLDRVRAVYCDQFRSALRATSGDALIASEAVLRDAAGHPVVEGLLRLPLRVDLVVRDESGQMAPHSVDSNSLVSFEPVEFRWGHLLHVHLAPFFWDSLQLRMTAADVSRDWLPLTRWFHDWFREADDGNGGELLDAVHFLSDPELRDGETHFALDLGSASVSALEHLLDAVATLGVQHVHLERPGGRPQ